ncbi:MAG TPA: ATP synthase F0 subunit B [Pyrinomonadaceae bacterium]|nr:ATP synthase F0 subunit B [Pyrinomonadaceae bacterium]
MFSDSFTLVALVAFAEGGLLPWWVNYPGLELWKFANLFLFIVAAFLLHRRFGRPVREALRSRSEAIKRELQTAREERDAALAKLSEVEARFASLDAEVAAVKEKARAEAEAEKARLALSTEKDIAKIKEQANREIESAAKAARQELRRFAADESVRLAENILKQEMKPEDDARLANLNVEELGRMQA